MSLTLSIDSIAYRGPGIGRAEGCVVFVPGTCPGETVVAEVVREKKSFKEAVVVSIENPSPDRLPRPDCRLTTVAGDMQVPGCVYGHVTREAELRYKQDQLRSFLTRQAKLEDAAALMLAPFDSPLPLHYRNKIKLRAGRDAQGRRILGYIGDDNETLVDIPQCPLAREPLNRLLTEIRADPGFWSYIGEDGQIALRWTEADGAVVVPEADRLGGEELPPLTEASPVVGKLIVPARAFFQVNPEVGAGLVEHVTALAEACNPHEFVDLYCGVGVFGLSASKRKIRHVTGFDSNRPAVRAAIENAKRLGLPARFYGEYVADVANRVLEQMAPARTMAVVDPPRAGLEPEVTAALVAHPVENLVYVSCSPDTLARDLALLTQAGSYAVKSIRLFDMFPRTAHFETAVHLERAGTAR